MKTVNQHDIVFATVSADASNDMMTKKSAFAIAIANKYNIDTTKRYYKIFYRAYSS